MKSNLTQFLRRQRAIFWLVAFLCLFNAMGTALGQWTDFGNPDFSSFRGINQQMVVDQSTGWAYVVQSDYSGFDDQYRATVYRRTNFGWFVHGNSAVPRFTGDSKSEGIVLVGGVPHICYLERVGSSSIYTPKVSYLNGPTTASNWVNLGLIEPDNVDCLAMSMDYNESTGELFVAYGKFNAAFGLYDFKVKKYNGTSWVDVGPAAGLINSGIRSSIIANGSDIYIAGVFGGIRVYKYNNSTNTWDDLVPFPQLSSIDGNWPNLQLHPDTNEAYIAYTDVDEGGVFVKKYDGTSWIQVGTVMSSVTAQISLGFNNSSPRRPHVAYRTTTGHVVVRYFDGTNWVQVGTNVDAGDFATLDFTTTGNVLIAYQPLFSNRTTAREFNPNEMRIVGNSTVINNNDNTPSIADHTNFDVNCAVPSSVTKTFTIQNISTTGISPIVLTGSTPVTISGSSDFTVTQPTLTSIPQGGSTTFSITYTPNTLSTQNAIVSIASNASNTTNYTFHITNGNIPSGAFSELSAVQVNRIAGGNAITGSTNGTGTAARFNFPQGIVEAADGNFYINDLGNSLIRKVTPTGVTTTFAGVDTPSGIALNTNTGTFYVTSRGENRLYSVSSTGTPAIVTLAASGSGYINGTLNTARFNFLQDVAVHPTTGVVYVADANNHAIRQIDISGNSVTTLAGAFPATAGFVDGIGTAARFRNPTGLAFDATGNFLYVADRGNHAIRKINMATGEVTTVAGNGTVGSTDGVGNAARFNNPTGLTLDASGNIFVADYDNHRIRLLLPNGTVSTLVGSSAGYADGNVSTATFTSPVRMTIGSDGNLWVAEFHNIRKVELSSLNNFTASCGTPSTSKPLAVVVNDLVSNLTITASTGFEVSLNPTSGFTSSLTFTPTGGTVNTTVYVRMNTTSTFTGTVNINSTCYSRSINVSGTVTGLPTAPTFTGTTNICTGGNTTLTATGLVTGATVRWYDAATGGTLLQTGASFTTPTVLTNTTYYVEQENTGGCVSPRTAVAITVGDATPPTAVCQTISATLNASGNVTVNASQLNNGSSDNCTPAASLNFVFDDTGLATKSFTCADVGSQSVTLRVTDLAGLSSTCTATINVVSSALPIANCQNSTVDLDVTGNVTVNASSLNNGSSVACGGSIVSYLFDDTGLATRNFSCANIGTNNVTLRITDNNGNTATCTATVTVRDVTIPSTALAFRVVNLDATGNVVVNASLFNNGSSDNCTPAAGLSFVFDDTGLATKTFTCANVGTQNVRIRTTDAAGNSTVGTIGLRINEGIVPTAVAQNITANLDASGSVTVNASSLNNGSSDNCTAAASLNFVFDDTGVATKTFNCLNIGANTVTIRVTDAAGNSSTTTAIVTVVDAILPTITAPTNVTATTNTACTATGVVLGTPTTNDNCTVASVTNNAPAVFPLGTTDVTWTVTDQSGNTNTATQTVTVTDATAPTAVCQNITATLTAAGTVTVNASNLNNGSSDNCTASLNFVFDDTGVATKTYSCTDIGNQNVTLRVTDAAGNQATCSATINVVSSALPIAVCQNITANLDATGNITVNASSLDNGSSVACGGSIVSYLFDDTGLATRDFSCSNIGANNVTLRITDNNGNTATCSATITVADNIAPTAVCQNLAVTLDAITGLATINASQLNNGSTDNCTAAGNLNFVFDDTGLATRLIDASSVSPQTLTLRVSDENGNVTTCTSTLTIDYNYTLTYSASRFNEANVNDGSIQNTILIGLNANAFSGTNGENFITTGKATVSNVPTGLTAELIKNANNEVEFRLVGNADVHTSTNNVNDLTLTFNNTAFTGGILANTITGFSRNDLEINFQTSFTTTPILVANSVTNFTATSVSTSQIRLNWTSATGTVTAYNLYRRGILIATLQPTQTTYLDTNLEADTPYSYKIETVNQTAVSNRVTTNARTFPAIPTVVVTPSSVCSTGVSSVGLSATPSLFRVYADSMSTEILLEANTYTFALPTVNQTTTFYISTVRKERNQELESRRVAVTVRVDEPVEAIILGDNSIISCENNILLKAQNSGNDATYTWLLNGQTVGNGLEYNATVSGLYSLQVTRGACFATSNQKNVRLNFSPLAQINTSRATFCQNGTLEARQIRTNATYEWLLNGNVVGNTTSLNVTQTGQYTLRVTENGCVATTSADIQIIDLPQVPQIIATNLALCPSETTTLSFTPQNGVTYRWIRNGRAIRSTENILTTNIVGKYQLEAIAEGVNSCSVISSEIEISSISVLPTYLNISENKSELILTSQEAIESIEWFKDEQGEVESITQWTNQTSVTPQEDGFYFAKITYSTGCQFQTRVVSFRITPPVIITGEDENTPKAFKVYPNPSSTGIFNIQFDKTLLENIEVTIFDAVGRKITTQTFEKGRQDFVISLDKVKKGLYLVRFIEKEKIYTYQLIID